ncbi:MAG: acyl carrier protein [Pirellulaceae bacterium]|nr:acyl carrier protein [Pirellulaceae bacterium]
MTEQVDIKKTITGVINRILTDSGRDAREIADADTFMDTIGLDSLDLAVMVVGLEQSLGVDPFRSGAQAVQTVGELVEIYRSAMNAS